MKSVELHERNSDGSEGPVVDISVAARIYFDSNDTFKNSANKTIFIFTGDGNNEQGDLSIYNAVDAAVTLANIAGQTFRVVSVYAKSISSRYTELARLHPEKYSCLPFLDFLKLYNEQDYFGDKEFVCPPKDFPLSDEEKQSIDLAWNCVSFNCSC